MTGRFPGYDVLKKRNTLSWNEPTRRAIDKRVAVHPGPRFFSAPEWLTLGAVCARIVPQPKDRPPVPLPAYVDEKMFEDHRTAIASLNCCRRVRPGRRRWPRSMPKRGMSTALLITRCPR